ncbi:thiol reductant ABC exporter subunit CydC [Metabacillus iocasae]|uniref:ATP-binding cassette subfamily C protein CydC n=1 Tax=Priestia iocasae TaxID=2291674 RepID=A0ABS2QU29_9BACI|nr:thiol reductant ABC exporter subunit CydC [Metabacillus iocasae]MBM7702985.1 ATP-binding cassette subfamily C protein CydC [Metabacillus iocasae]
MRDLVPIIRLMWKEKKDIWLTILFGFLAGVLGVALFASSGYLISKAALLPPLYTLTVMLALLKLIGISRALSRYGERLVSHRGTFTILGNIRVTFFEKLEPLTPRILHKYRSGDLLSRIVGDVESLQNFFLRVFYPPLVFLLVFLSTIFFTTFYSVNVAWTLFAGMIVTGVIVPLFFTWTQKRVEDSVQGNRNVLSSEVTELLYGFRDLKIYGRLHEKEEQLRKLSDVYIEEQRDKENRGNRTQSLNMAVAMVVSCAVLAVGAYEVVEGRLDGLYLAMLVMISLNVFEFSIPLAAFPGYAEDSRRAASRLFSVVNETPIKQERLLDVKEGPISIDVQHVQFLFDHMRPTLNNVSVSFPAGSKTAIVGPSGSGKSTLLQLVMNMYPADEGEITVNGTSINELNQESLWAKSNVVLQENHFFYGTIRENLCIAREDAKDNELQDVLTAVGLTKLLDDPVYEKGENLSGGEKQKLAIARALLRQGQLWLLDEPTSSMDVLAERRVYDEIFARAKNDTLILVSHRLTGLEQMDQIIVMDGGEIIEVGSFDELMANKGYFYGLKEVERSVLF